MTYTKGVKLRIYPNKHQRDLIERTFGCTRFVYNHALDLRNKAYEDGNKLYYKDTSADLTAMKKADKYAFLNEVDSIALQQSLRDLDRAFVNFFEHRARHPRFHSKHSAKQSYRTVNQGDNIRIENKHIKLPKFGWVKVKQSLPVGKIKNVTVKRTPTGKYFAVLVVEFEPETRPNAGGSVGIDVGIKEFYTDSNGSVVLNPKYLERSERKLRREQRRLSRKQKSSNNRNKQRVRVAAVHEKVVNQRTDFLQKTSTILLRENQAVCIEDLNVKGMVRNHKLAKHIASVSWSRFFEMLSYKAEWYGNEIIKVPTFYPSSQTCNCCGYQNPIVKNLFIRDWTCPVCGAYHDRDGNAAVNILRKGLSQRPAA